MRPMRPLVAIVVSVAILAAMTAAFALAAAPAHAFSQWQHNGATGCVCHDAGSPTDASCHYPGQDTSTLASPSSACSQECHSYDAVTKAYDVAFTHGTNPHRGPSTGCLACHQTSVSISDPGSSPHHSGQQTGFTACATCHSGYKQHRGLISCTTCHARAEAFHTYQASSPGFSKCRTCHAKKHAGRSVPNSKCSSCHKGRGSGPAAKAQHSTGVKKLYKCGACHSKPLHAKSLGSGIVSCRSCHGGKYHAKQKRPGNSTCTRCHTAGARHANGFSCLVCHRRAVHNARPNALPRR
jgi:hypothetical protein